MLSRATASFLILSAVVLTTLGHAAPSAAEGSVVGLASPRHGSFTNDDSVSVQGGIGATILEVEWLELFVHWEYPEANYVIDGRLTRVGGSETRDYIGPLSIEATWKEGQSGSKDLYRAYRMDLQSFTLNGKNGSDVVGQYVDRRFEVDRNTGAETTTSEVTMEMLEFGASARDDEGVELTFLNITPDTELITYHVNFEGTNGGIGDPSGWSVTVNGDPVPVAANGTFSAIVDIDHDALVNPIVAKATHGNTTHVSRVVVLAGDSLEDGKRSPSAVAARVGQSGLEEIVEYANAAELLLAAIDLESLKGQKSKECVWSLPLVGCMQTRESEIREVPEIRGDIGFDFDFNDDQSTMTVLIEDIRVEAKARDTAMFANTWCNLRIDTDLEVTAKLNFEAKPYQIELKRNAISVKEKGFSWKWTSGPCNTGFWDWISQEILEVEVQGQVAEEAEKAINGELLVMLDDLNVTQLINGPLGELGISVDAPFKEITADSKGLTVIANLGATATCNAPVGAPILEASYSEVNSSEGPFPLGGFPGDYNFAASVSTSAANQVMKTQIECGLLREAIEELDIFGNGTLYPTTLGFMSIVVKPFSELTDSKENGGYGMDPLTLVRLEVAPTLAPILVSGGGPSGEALGLKVPHVAVRMIDSGTVSNFPDPGVTPKGTPEQLLLEAVVDFELGIDVGMEGSEVHFTIGTPPEETFVAVVTENPFQLDSEGVEGVVPGLVSAFIPALAGALDSIPVPTVFGEQIYMSQPFEVGEHIGLNARLGEAE